MFRIALGPVTICIAIRIIGLIYYIYYNIGWHFWTPEIVQRLEQLRKSVGSFGIRCGIGWVLGGLAGTISSWAVPEKTAKNTQKRWFLGIKTTNCRPGHFYTFYSWQILEIFVINSSDPNLNVFLFLKMLIRCWDTRVQSYSSSASEIKSIYCLAWPHLHFLFVADGWNFCDIFLKP